MAKKKTEEKAEVIAEIAQPKKQFYSLHAWFAYIDKEGFKVKSEYKSEGGSAQELLDNLKDFPAGVNRLVTVTVKHNENELERALAPHKARAILEKKNVVDFNEVFRGV